MISLAMESFQKEQFGFIADNYSLETRLNSNFSNFEYSVLDCSHYRFYCRSFTAASPFAVLAEYFSSGIRQWLHHQLVKVLALSPLVRSSSASLQLHSKLLAQVPCSHCSSNWHLFSTGLYLVEMARL